MGWSRGRRIFGGWCIAAAVLGVCASGSEGLADATSLEVYSDAVALGVPASQDTRLVPSDFIEQLSAESPTPVNNGLTIAEPGTLGLMALAGLMGGAMAMRRRLG